VRVTGQASTAVTRGLVCELKAQGHHEGDDQFHKGLAVTKKVKVRGFILEIDGDGPVFTGRAVLRMGHPQVRWSLPLMTQDEGKTA
jgi:hypothetical protein